MGKRIGQKINQRKGVNKMGNNNAALTEEQRKQSLMEGIKKDVEKLKKIRNGNLESIKSLANKNKEDKVAG